MKSTATIGRYLYAIPILVFGIFHFLKPDDMAAVVPSFIPGDIFWVYLTGAGLIAASLAIVTGIKAKLACLLLGIMLLIFVFTIHLPSVLNGNQMGMPMLLKDLAMAGAAWVIGGNFKD